jgi:hypothetical protein
MTYPSPFYTLSTCKNFECAFQLACCSLHTLPPVYSYWNLSSHGIGQWLNGRDSERGYNDDQKENRNQSMVNLKDYSTAIGCIVQRGKLMLERTKGILVLIQAHVLESLER